MSSHNAKLLRRVAELEDLLLRTEMMAKLTGGPQTLAALAAREEEAAKAEEMVLVSARRSRSTGGRWCEPAMAAARGSDLQRWAPCRVPFSCRRCEA